MDYSSRRALADFFRPISYNSFSCRIPTGILRPTIAPGLGGGGDNANDLIRVYWPRRRGSTNPERRSAMRDHVMRRLREPTQKRRGSRFPAIGLGDGAQGAGWGAAGISALTHLQPFYCAEFGSKEGDFRVNEFAQFAQFAQPAGRTSIAVPLHDRLKGPPLPRRPTTLPASLSACPGGGAVGTGTVPVVAMPGPQARRGLPAYIDSIEEYRIICRKNNSGIRLPDAIAFSVTERVTSSI